ncbi:MAG: hypothetical protein AABZ39_10620 [Spirochaetota bacterium]
MRITSDWHIHSRNSCDSACMTMADLMAETPALGVTDFGVTDHLHTPFNLPDIVNSRKEYLASTPSPRFHFGVEVSSVSKWEIDEIRTGAHKDPVYGLRSGGKPDCELAIGLTEEDIAANGIEYVVGGTHWPMYVPFERDAVIRDYHRQNMFLAAHPLVDIVAHPWWWMGHWADEKGRFNGEPWFDDLTHIPQSMHDEFAKAAREHGTAVEINISAILLNPYYPEHFARQYLEYVAYLKQAGVSLSIGSDCHSAHYSKMNFGPAVRMLDSIGIRDEDLWKLPPLRTGGAAIRVTTARGENVP